MPCGWRCSAEFSCTEMRKHFTEAFHRMSQSTEAARMDQIRAAVGAAARATNIRSMPRSRSAADGACTAVRSALGGLAQLKSTWADGRPVRRCRAAGIAVLG
jgi:hypothetical protein